MQKSKKFAGRSLLVLMLMLGMILSMCTASFATDTYTYDIWGNTKPAPAAYELERTIYADDLGVENMTGVSGIFARNGKVYIIFDGTVVIADDNFEKVDRITEYTRDDGTVSAIKKPTGIFATEEGHIYVCEMNQGEIIEFDENYEFVRAIGDPNCTGLTVTYAPQKVAVDSVGRIFVLVKSCYEGFAELTPDGEFNRYVGATPVTVSAIDRLWRSLQTEAQQARSALWLPTTYSDLAIDQDGFLFASITGLGMSDPVRKLNSAGDDVMQEYEFVDRPMGDNGNGISLSNLTGVAVADDGRFAVLDSNKNRVFVYSADANLMYEMGGKGHGAGRLSSPIGLTFMGDKIAVIDSTRKTVEIFAPTPYGSMINSALEAQSRYAYDEAAVYWQQVADINNSFYYANLGLGKHQMRVGEYEEAMENFYIGADRSYYSSAYQHVSKAWMNENFALIVGVIAAIIVLFIAWTVYKKFFKKAPKDTKLRRVWEKVKFTMFKWPGYVLSSPFKAFDDVKYYNDGSLVFSIIIIIAFGWIALIKYRYTGFMLNFVDLENVNAPLIVGSAILPYVVFIIGNWAVGVLLSGKGRMKDITKVVAYSMYPACWLNLVGTVLSNFVSENDAAIVGALFTLGMVLFFFYMFVGTIMVNQYTFTKNVATLLLSVVAMLIIIFIMLLFATLFVQFVNDMLEIITEINLLS